MEAYVIANQKGGVGKSTLSVHKAFKHAAEGARVLFIDFDGQGNSTKTLSQRAVAIPFDTVHLFDDPQTNPVPPLKGQPGITLIAGKPGLDEVERKNNNVVLHPKAQLAPYVEEFDYCIMDTPPTLGLRLIAALISAHFVICPFELAGYSTDGLQRMINTITGVKTNFNPELEFLGMLPNRVNGRSKKHQNAIKTLYGTFADHIIKQPLKNLISIEEATDTGKPIWELTSSTARPGAKDMLQALDVIADMAKKRAS